MSEETETESNETESKLQLVSFLTKNNDMIMGIRAPDNLDQRSETIAVLHPVLCREERNKAEDEGEEERTEVQLFMEALFHLYTSKVEYYTHDIRMLINPSDFLINSYIRNLERRNIISNEKDSE